MLFNTFLSNFLIRINLKSEEVQAVYEKALKKWGVLKQEKQSSLSYWFPLPPIRPVPKLLNKSVPVITAFYTIFRSDLARLYPIK